MSRHVFRLPDLGEGTVSAEIVEWRVRPGEFVREDQPLVEMSTDKAVVEVPSPVSGRVVAVTGGPGDAVAVGSELAVFETEVEATATGVAGASVVAPGVPPLMTARWVPSSSTVRTPPFDP
jgi:pyruvate/2-oxoglutarate dehydrogenase complex dihydrolipoamide acyltransferase (E2) component